MFAYNEEQLIEASVRSIYNQVDKQLSKFIVLANGCTDQTISVAQRTKEQLCFNKMEIVELSFGDKCNAWNTYVHELSDTVDTHFFCDADLSYSKNCFPNLYYHLATSRKETVVVAGLPLSGRNKLYYQSLVKERACFFGGLYGVKGDFLQRIKDSQFRLPIGLNWIDSTLTKAVNTDLKFDRIDQPNRTTWLNESGYYFESLSVFDVENIKLYKNRIARYELGKLQEVFLNDIPYTEWPLDLSAINLAIWNDFDFRTEGLNIFKKHLVKKRLMKFRAAVNL